MDGNERGSVQSLRIACGTWGNALTVGEATAGGDSIHFACYLSRGDCRQDLRREYFEVHCPKDMGMRRVIDRPEGRLVHLPDLWTEDERRTSPVYNEGWRRLEARNGLESQRSRHGRCPRTRRGCRRLGHARGNSGL